MKTITVRSLLIIITALSVCVPASAKAKPDAPPVSEETQRFLDQPIMQFKNYAFDPKSPLESRIGPCPGVVLETLKNWDGRSDYAPYAPTKGEEELVRGYLRSFPPGMKKAFTERLLGFYFVKNFTGNGMNSWVLDASGNVYVWIVLNPAGFATTLSETVTSRDASAFKADPGVSIDCGNAERGILYTLLHEGTHSFDYIRGITPFVDNTTLKYLRGGKGADASWDVWESYRKPRPKEDFPLRDQVKFFGLGGGPQIEAKDARRLYDGLKKSPFASLYGGQSWAEDAADLATFYHITQVLGRPYIITLPDDGTAGPMKLEPMKSKPVLQRAKRVYQKMR